MKKRIISFVFAISLIFCVLITSGCLGRTYAESQNGYIGQMEIVNCSEWVSLRQSPSTSSSRLVKVPLGAKVAECYWYNSDFIYCEYENYQGYILAEYLEAVQSENKNEMEYLLPSGTVLVGERRDTKDGEGLILTCTDPSGQVIWTRTEETDVRTELRHITAFIGGTVEKPVLMVYNAFKGLTALELADGSEKWCLSAEEVSLGSSVSFAIDEEGTMYIGGYYGPDPVAVSVDGKVLWKTHNEHEAYWLYGIELTQEGILAKYDAVVSGDNMGEILYDYEGNEISFKINP